MENRERDKVSKNTGSTRSKGDVNRETSPNSGKEQSDSNADFGQNISRSEELNEPSRKSGSRSNLGENISDKSEIDH